MEWLTQTLLAALYPGAPYERKYLAVLLLETLLEVWNSPDAGCKSYIRPEGVAGRLPASNAGMLVVGRLQFKAFCHNFFHAQTTKLLLGRAPAPPKLARGASSLSAAKTIQPGSCGKVS